MPLNLKIMLMGIVVIFISFFVLLYIFNGISSVKAKCKTDKSLNICKMNSLPIVILMLLLIAGGLIVVINITAYIMMSGSTSGGYDKKL